MSPALYYSKTLMSPACIYIYTTWRHWCLQLVYAFILLKDTNVSSSYIHNFWKVTPASLWTQGYSFSLKIKCWGISFICRSPRISERLHLHPCVHRDTALAFKIIYWGISFICRSPVINEVKDINVSNSYIHLCYSKTLMSPACIYIYTTRRH